MSRWSNIQGQFADHRPPTFPTVDELEPYAPALFAWLDDEPDRLPRTRHHHAAPTSSGAGAYPPAPFGSGAGDHLRNR